MVFHTYAFVLGALPVCYICFLLAHRIGGWPAAFRFLAVASLAFYAQWSLTLLAVLVASVVFNYAVGALILRYSANRRLAGALLVFGIVANLAALGQLKYANFLIDIYNAFVENDQNHIALIVPIGVSFYTFIQIGYLIEANSGRVGERPEFMRYVLFATFLPCVTAGPLVQQREMFDQMKGRSDSAFDSARLAAGLSLFAMGLFKKVVFADQIAPFADATFAGVAAGQAVAPATAWLGSLCYALQLYFDFSGYSDMAIGIGCIFGLRLPLNFDSPFKATNISEFWRRWHITMTRFFTTYVYTPIAVSGMRKTLVAHSGEGVKYLRTAAVPAIVTFLIAGIWHGAGWTFIVYGLVHGIAIATYLGWSRLNAPAMPAPLGWALTMGVVVSALVIFRAPDLETAGSLLVQMWSFGLLMKPEAGAAMVSIDLRGAAAMVIVLGSIVLLMPNTQQILHRIWVSTDDQPANAVGVAGLLAWKPTIGGAVAVAAVLAVAIGSIGAGSTFLYYQF